MDLQRPVIFEQHAFLSNSTNKDNFIQLLMSHLDREGCRTIQSQGDADIDIVSEALAMASKQQSPISVVGDDTDLLVLLTYYWKENMSDVWLLSEAKRAASKATEGTAFTVCRRKTWHYCLSTTSCSSCIQWMRHHVCFVRSRVREGTSDDNCC